MWKVAEKQYTPILTGLRALVTERGWEVDVVPLVVGQRSVREKEWLESLRIFGIGKEDGKRIIDRLGHTLLNEHEKLFGSYWRHTFGPCSTSRLEWRGHRNGGESLVVEYLSPSLVIVNLCESL